MFVAIYSFKVIKGKEGVFKSSWKSLTKLIYKYESSFGSRLHKSNDNLFVAYAMWPDKKTWKNAGENLPIEAGDLREMMGKSCLEIKTEYELEIEENLLKSHQYPIEKVSLSD